MGGLKRKIDTEKKIERKDPPAVNFSKRLKGIYSKACVVAALLADQTPPRDDDDEDGKLGFWWEDESLANTEYPEDLGDGIDYMTKMFHEDFDPEVETKSEGMPMNGVSTYQNPCSDFEAVVDGEFDRDFYDNNIHLSDLDEDQIIAISDNNNNNNVLPEDLSWFSQELDIDYETNSESLLMDLMMDGVSMATCSDSETVEDGGLVIQRDLDEDRLCFSDLFNELTSTDAL